MRYEKKLSQSGPSFSDALQLLVRHTKFLEGMPQTDWKELAEEKLGNSIVVERCADSRLSSFERVVPSFKSSTGKIIV